MVSLWQLFAVLVIGIIMVLVTVLIVILIETRFGPKFIARSWSRLKTVFCSQDADQLLKYAVAYNGVLWRYSIHEEKRLLTRLVCLGQPSR